MGIRSLQIFSFFRHRDVFIRQNLMSTDVRFWRQILTYKDGPISLSAGTVFYIQIYVRIWRLQTSTYKDGPHAKRVEIGIFTCVPLCPINSVSNFINAELGLYLFQLWPIKEVTGAKIPNLFSDFCDNHALFVNVSENLVMTLVPLYLSYKVCPSIWVWFSSHFIFLEKSVCPNWHTFIQILWICMLICSVV